MAKLRLLIVEDDERELSTFRESVRVFKSKYEVEIESIECKTVDDAFENIDSSFDGAIIDLKLDDHDDGGQQVIFRIKESFFRIPMAILTGYPYDWNGNQIKVYVKGETTHEEILTRFRNIYNTGLTRIMGGRGSFEEYLNGVFTNNLIPQIDRWIEYGQNNSDKTERALLRHTLNHLSYLLDDESENCYPEEFYLCPPLNESLRTGRIVNKKNESDWYVIMNPACDLVKRGNGGFKTDRILMAAVEPVSKLFPWHKCECLDEEQRNKLTSAFNNNNTFYHHWLPETGFFDGGFLNFRKLTTLRPREFRQQFDISLIQISPSFIKDIVSRFSSYYARQGQPGIELAGFINGSSSEVNGSNQ